MAANISIGDTCPTIGEYDFDNNGTYVVCSDETDPPTWKEVVLK